jgi:rhodanese-related sulfurtransferase
MKHNPGFLKLVEEARQHIRECTVEQVKGKLDCHEPFEFIDVREDTEYAQNHARGAIHLGRGVLERDVETMIPNKQAEIVLYCGGGYRSALAANSLRQMGYSNLASMTGGIKAWQDAGYPIDRG